MTNETLSAMVPVRSTPPGVSAPAGACALPARDLARRIADGDLDPRAVVEEFVQRAGEVQEAVHPFTFVLADAAREAAEESARRVAEGSPRALEGVPVAVKELTAVAGQPHTLGSLVLRDNVATATDPGVQALLDAGAIPFARTNTPEFGCASVTDNLLFGPTINPWNPAFSTAGSSGGAAAAVATFAAPLAQGTDSAGSLRMPSAACGVVGFKPSHGVVPVAAPDYLDSFGHNGPIARDVADVRLMFEVMARPDPARLMARVPQPPRHDLDLGSLRVAMITGMDGLVTDPDVESNLRTTAERLAAAGASVEHVAFPWDWDRLFRCVRLSFGAVYMAQARRLLDAGAPLTDLTRAFVADVEPLTRDYGFMVDARAETAVLHEALGAVFADADVILMPTLQMPAPIAGDHFIESGPVVAGEPSADRWIVAFTVPFNLASACPAITLPNGWSRDGIPTAAQLIAQPYRDHDLLRWAGEAEELIG